MELLRFEADAYCRLTTIIGQILSHLEAARIGRNSGISLTDNLYTTFGSSFGEIGLQVEKLNLSLSKKQVDRMRWTVVNQGSAVTDDWISRNLQELLTRVIDELNDRLFLAVPTTQAEMYLQPTSPFGDAVNTKLPVAEDASEAAKCLALDRPTAAVFHLMRVMEISVQRLGDKLGVKLVEEKNWQVILDQVGAAIRKRDHRDAETKAYAEVASHLYNVKVAWRNEVMHPKQTYTFEEAKSIFDNVKTFTNDLVDLV